MNEKPLTSMYVGDDCAYIDFHDRPIVLPLSSSFFENGRGALDQTVTELERVLQEMCWICLEQDFGYMPPGRIKIEESFDKKFNIMIYEAHYLPLVSTLSSKF